jgi:hypothetical protein
LELDRGAPHPGDDDPRVKLVGLEIENPRDMRKAP